MDVKPLDVRFAVLVAAIAVFTSSCDEGQPPVSPPQETAVALPPTHAEYIARLQAAGLTDTLLVERWLAGAHRALRRPVRIGLPHEERGAFVPHDVRSVGLAFEAIEGQTLTLEIERSADSSGRLFAQLFFVDPASVETRFREVAVLTDTAGDTLALATTGRYVLRLQPELHAAIDFRVRVELDAALPFPVSGHTRRSVRSFFGDVRDGGRRRHEGIDIFARRGTPVLAVTDGIAMPRQSPRGGDTVWLRGEGRSFYFAHLDSVAIESRTRVRAGDVLGTVGNTGNARTTPPHLHFGIYRRGYGAIDPFPYFESATFTDEPPPSDFERGFAAVVTAGLNLRETPGTNAASLARLDAGSVVEARAAAGDWLRIEQADGTSGWIHRRYQRRPVADAPLRVARDTWLHATPDGVPIARARVGDALHRFAADSVWVLVGVDPAEPLGWVRIGKAW